MALPLFLSKRVQKSYSFAVHLIAIAVVLPFVVLAAYCHPYFDDYGTALELKRTGFAYYLSSHYQSWTGRYALLLANSVHPLRFGGLRAYQWTAAGLVVGLVGSCYLLGWGLTAGQQLRLPARLALGSGLAVAMLALLPSPAEGFYWVVGGYNYLLPILAAFSGLAAGCGYAATPARLPHRQWLLLPGMLVAAALFPGFSEFSACLSLLVMGSLLVAFPRASWPYRVAAALAVVGAVAMLAAPGNLGRLHQNSHEWHLVRAAVLATGATGYTLMNWLAFPTFWVLAGMGLPLWKKLATRPGPVARLVYHPLLWPFLMVAGLLGCYLFSYLTIQQPLPLRARNLLYAYFMVTGIFSLVGIIQFAQRRNWALPHVPQLVLLLLLVITLLSDGNGRLRGDAIGRGYNTVGQAYRDWLSGDARRFDEAERRRYALLRATTADSVAVPPLPVTPATLFYFDIGPSAGLWGNQYLAHYFDKKAVWVQWKKSTPHK